MKKKLLIQPFFNGYLVIMIEFFQDKIYIKLHNFGQKIIRKSTLKDGNTISEKQKMIK